MRTVLMRIWAAAFLALWLAGTAVAQTDLAGDLDRWSRLADQTEGALDAPNTDEATFSDLRTDIVSFRSEFDAAKGLNATRIATLREQIAALGPAPDPDAATPEPLDVTATRDKLNEQLSALLVPVQRAEAEFVRADALVSQIDQTLRERQTQELLNTTPSPLNPVYWKPAYEDFVSSLNALWQQPPDANASVDDIDLRSGLPLTLLYGALGFVLILRGRRWSQIIAASLRRLGANGLGIWRFLASLLRIVLPFLGLILLAMAAISTGYFGPKVNESLLLIAILGGMMLAVRWVSERVFSRDDDEALIPVSMERRRELRFHVACITALIVVSAIIEQVLETGDTALSTLPVLLFPFTVLAAISLYRIGLILRGYEAVESEKPEDSEPRSTPLVRIIRGFGTGAVAVAIVAPLLSAAGYYSAADALLPPYIMTLALLGLVMALQRFTADVYGAVTGQGTSAREALMPVLFGMILLILVAPLLALVWGARLTDLTELWAAFVRGFAVGESRISPTDFLAFAVIFAIGYVLTRLLQSALRNNVLPKTHIEIGAQNAMVSGLGYVGIFLAALAAITGAGIDLSSLAIVAGALSVGIGFGLQNIVSNFVSGIILLIERPISEGDWIEVGGQMGFVRDISVRSTRIETFDRSDVIVPNADLVSGTVTNYTRGNTVGRVIVQVGVAYGTDTREVERILREIAEAQPMVLANPPPSIVFMGLGASTYDFEIRAILRDVNWMLSVKSDINHAVVARFEEAGIEMAFPQRDIWLRNPEALSVPADAPAATTSKGTET